MFSVRMNGSSPPFFSVNECCQIFAGISGNRKQEVDLIKNRGQYAPTANLDHYLLHYGLQLSDTNGVGR